MTRVAHPAQCTTSPPPAFTPCPRCTGPPRPGCPPWPTPVMTAPASAFTSRSSSHPAGENSISTPEPERHPAVPALPGRTRVRPAHRPLAHPPAHHRQPQQNRRHRPRRARPHPFRARLHHMKFAEITSVSGLACLLGLRHSAGKLSGDIVVSQAGGQLGRADQDVESEVFQEHGLQVAAFDDLDAAVAGGEVPAGFAHPGGGD